LRTDRQNWGIPDGTIAKPHSSEGTVQKHLVPERGLHLGAFTKVGMHMGGIEDITPTPTEYEEKGRPMRSMIAVYRGAVDMQSNQV